MNNQSLFIPSANRTINRTRYLAAGLSLAIVKFVVDWTIATQLFNFPWKPANYLIWPSDHVVRILDLPVQEKAFSLEMLFVSLPFIWIGITLTVRRLRDAGLPLWLVVMFFVPVLNLVLFILLSVLPTRLEPVLDVLPVPEDTDESDPYRPLRRLHRNIVQQSYWRSGLLSLAITVPLSVLCVVVGAQVFQSYGFSLFVGAPFAMGMFSVLVFGYSQPKSFSACIGVAMATATLAGLAIIVIALEGLICLIMAAPIAFVLVFLGALVGYVIQSRAWLIRQAPNLGIALLLAVPGLMAAEWASDEQPTLRAIETEVVIDAPPTEVWKHVIAFPPLPEPDDWFFQTGVAYPRRADIEGTGVGAVRHCVFSTGTFVEPIEIWKPPTLLRFSVTEQPEPMREWSPYEIHPPHLHQYLDSKQGQFLLEALPDGRTRLVGTTWYSNRMWPAPYWYLWSDFIIHRIHARVLSHIKQLAETPSHESAEAKSAIQSGEKK